MTSLHHLHRRADQELIQLLKEFPAVAIVGARQVGKTTLARALAEKLDKPSIYLDLELPGDHAKVQQAELFLRAHQDKCIILDEVQREKSLFPILRGLIDEHRIPGRFILLGSASPDLIRDTSESLAGRIAWYNLNPFSIDEIDLTSDRKLWLRGGFPNSFLAESEESSMRWRHHFIQSYVERDLPLLGMKSNPVANRRLWEMLTHLNTELLNISALSRSLGIPGPKLKEQTELFQSAYLIHLLPPFFPNIKKRLIKSPKIYLLDTGIAHCFLGVENFDSLMGHPSAGASFENFILNQTLSKISSERLFFYRTADGTEMDFVITKNGKPHICVEVKMSTAPSVNRSFTIAKRDLNAPYNYIVAPVLNGFPLSENVQVVSPREYLELIH